MTSPFQQNLLPSHPAPAIGPTPVKSINDNGGHSAGDAALRSVATVLTASASPGSIIGRLGGLSGSGIGSAGPGGQ